MAICMDMIPVELWKIITQYLIPIDIHNLKATRKCLYANNAIGSHYYFNSVVNNLLPDISARELVKYFMVTNNYSAVQLKEIFNIINKQNNMEDCDAHDFCTLNPFENYELDDDIPELFCLKCNERTQCKFCYHAYYELHDPFLHSDNGEHTNIYCDQCRHCVMTYCCPNCFKNDDCECGDSEIDVD